MRITVTLTWRNVAPDIFDMRFTMRQNMFATGMNSSVHILKRSVLKGNITMLLYPTQQKNLLELFLQWKNQVKHTKQPLNLIYKYPLFRAPAKMLLLSCSFQGTDCNEKSLPLFLILFLYLTFFNS